MEANEIFNQYLPAWGICPYEALEPYLLSCAARRRLPAGAQSVVIALFPYALEDDAYSDANLSRYAVVPDYHVVAKERLDAAAAALRDRYPEETFAVFIDNSPFPEVSAAVHAGLGVKGKNGLLIHPLFGSWVFIGEIVSTREFLPTPPAKRECIGCGRCVVACPTGALTTAGFEKTKCLSAITQQKQPLTPEQAQLIRDSGCIWGCDICQKVCPMNKNASATTMEEFINGAETRARTEGDLEDRAYLWRGIDVVKRNLRLMEEE